MRSAPRFETKHGMANDDDGGGSGSGDDGDDYYDYEVGNSASQVPMANDDTLNI